MEKLYKTEKEGQIDFFNNYGIPWQESDGVLVENCTAALFYCFHSKRMIPNFFNRKVYRMPNIILILRVLLAIH